ncbi:MAG: CDP-glycerol glycerophosphotransferase family protein [Mogibacterium sp.]|nr:CDP-glycerol glycerophosphotransferase family protein [Mogibacterium sp.]
MKDAKMIFQPCDILKETEIFATVESVSAGRGTLRLGVLCPPSDIEWKQLVIGYTYKIESDREDYLVEPVSVSENGFGILLEFVIDAEAFPFKPTNWTVRIAGDKDGEKYAARIQYTQFRLTPEELLAGQYRCTDSKGHLLYAHRVRGSYLGLRYREMTPYDDMKIKKREVKAQALAKKNKKELERKDICLIYEKKCAKAQDNAYYLFKYCMDNDMESYLGKSIYYVITEDSPDRKKLEPYANNLIIFGSTKHMEYMLASTLLISADSKSHGYIWQYDRSIIGNKMGEKRFIFLGHGVLALKKLNDSFPAERMNAVLTTVTSDAEADIVIRELGYTKSQAVVTGYARFDALEDKSQDYREILIMPTHRKWLFGVDRTTFMESEYYRRYMELINSPELTALLRENDLTANFYLHPSICEHFDAFSSSDDRVKLVPMGSVPLDDLLMKCRLLVSDYSSVCWDLYYMGKPAVFYQYDVPEYMDTWGSYIDLEKDTPGPRAEELGELIEHIRGSIERGFKLDDYWASKREQHFRYIDRDNCKRICEVIKERGL